MKLLGAKVNSVKIGSKTLKDAVNEAIRDWVTNVDNTFYVLGSALGPHPYPTMVRDFQRIIGDEARNQILEAEGRLPNYIVAAVGGGSNSIGIFYPFINVIILKLASLIMGDTFVVEGWILPFFIALFISFTTLILDKLITKNVIGE